MDELKVIGENVERAIKGKGYRSVELFAHEHRIDKAILSRLINGKQGVNLRTFLKITRALDLTPNDLYTPAKALNPEERATKDAERRFKAWQQSAKRSQASKAVLYLSETQSFEVKKDPRNPNILLIRVTLQSEK